MMLDEYQISVVILTYNSDFEKLKLTIESILNQKDCYFEIIISDDGSKVKYSDQIIALFESHNFKDYIFSELPENAGTCQNYYNGVALATGRYIKGISPGDYLHDCHTLSDWYNFMMRNHCRVSFGNSVYYNITNDEAYLLRLRLQPQLDELYLPNTYNRKKAVLDYIFLLDVPIGASFLVERDLLQEYLTVILGKVKYTEDNIFRIMICDGIPLFHFDRRTIYYEYGTGISTSSNNRWKKIIHDEIALTNSIIVERIMEKNYFDKRLKLLLRTPYRSKKYTILKYILFPTLSILKIRKNHANRFTELRIDENDFFSFKKIIVNLQEG